MRNRKRDNKGRFVKEIKNNNLKRWELRRYDIHNYELETSMIDRFRLKIGNNSK